MNNLYQTMNFHWKFLTIGLLIIGQQLHRSGLKGN